MIGIFGGTFDPVHFGHLRPALELLQELQFDEIRFVPCNVPPHRRMPVADARQRVRMLEAALQTERRMVIDGRELLRDGPSYMVDTLTSLRTEYGNTPLCLIVGSDAFRGLPSWHRWQELLGLAHIVVAKRPNGGRAEGELVRLLEQRAVSDRDALAGAAAGRILEWPVTQLEISSSSIRDLVRNGRSPRWLLPDAVLEVMREEGIYA